MTCSQKKIWVSTKKNLRTPTPDITYQHNLVLGLTPYLNFPQKANGIKLTFSTNKGSKMEDKHCDWLFRNVINLFKKLIPTRIFFSFQKTFEILFLPGLNFYFSDDIWCKSYEKITKNSLTIKYAGRTMHSITLLSLFTIIIQVYENVYQKRDQTCKWNFHVKIA